MRLSAIDLVKTYSGRNVVNGVSLEVEQGEVVGLLGPNGAGKTTTFYMMVGLINPNRGEVLLDGTPITKMPMYKRARAGIGYLPQEPSIFRRLSVRENILAILEMQGLTPQAQVERLAALLEELRISHLADGPGYTLSGGERRRVEIARALATSPKFILLDEPFTGIDPIAIEDIRRIIAELRGKGIGILLTDHNVRETLTITDRSYIISQGEIITKGPSSLLPNDPVARKYYLGERFEL